MYFNLRFEASMILDNKAVACTLQVGNMTDSAKAIIRVKGVKSEYRYAF